MRGTSCVPSVYVLLRKGGKLAFVLRQNTGYKDGFYTLPAGHAEGNESYRVAAARETLEEAGVTVQPDHLQHVHTMQRHCGDHVRVDLFFAATEWEGEPYNAEPHLHSELAWFSEDALPHGKIMNYQAVALQALAQSQTYSETED